MSYGYVIKISKNTKKKIKEGKLFTCKKSIENPQY